MRIGLGSTSDSLAGVVEEARAAQRDGFAALWFSNIFGLDALTACAVVGREVPGLEVGTAVVPTFPRHPYAMAQQAKTVQQACDGRLVLGIGLSHQIVIETLLGMSYDKPARHMREYLSVLMPLLRDGAVSHQSDVYAVQATLTVDTPPPVVVVAALGPVMLEIAGTLADGTTTWTTGVKTLREHIVPSITRAADGAGRRAPRIVAGLPVCVTNDEAGARGRAAAEFAVYGQLPSYRAMLDREGADGPADVAVVGDERQVAASVVELREAGVTDLDAVLFGTPDEQRRTRELLAALVT